MQLDENASAAWLASTVNRKLPATALENLDIGATARRALNHKSLQSLRVEGHLMFGVVALVAQKTHNLATRTNRTRRELERELGNSNNLLRNSHKDAEEPLPSQTLDIISSDFNLERVMNEFRPSQLSVDSDDGRHDISIDDELRGEVDDELRPDDGDMVAPDVLSEGDEQLLRDILGDAPLDAPVPDEAPAPESLDEEAPQNGDLLSDMDVPMSDEIHEAETPGSSADLDPAPSKRPRARKKRLCPVDDRPYIAQPARAPALALAKAAPCAPAEDETDDFFDPERISAIVKRRRLADIPSDVPELEADVSVAGISMDGLMDDMGDQSDNGMDLEDAGQDRPAATQDVVASILEQDNLEDLMAQEIQTARHTIKAFGSGDFSEIATGTRRSRAALLSETLALATNGEIDIEQDAPYREIQLLSI